MIEITIFTPTYNRAYTLEILFESLVRQEAKNFEWIVVDDGSTDETETLIMKLKKIADFPIIYHYKNNEGKHIAINTGARLASGKWFFIVDSDDYLTDDATAKVSYYCNTIEEKQSFAGVVGLRGNETGKAWQNWYGKKVQVKKATSNIPHYVDATIFEYRYKLRMNGDRAEVVRTELLKKYPFPKFADEKFLVETWLWLSIGKDGYKFRWFNDVIYITEYLDDGLTQNIAKQYINAPIGSCEVQNLRLSCKHIPFVEQIRSIYNYFRYGKIAKIDTIKLFEKCNKKALIPIGILVYIIYDKFQHRKT